MQQPKTFDELLGAAAGLIFDFDGFLADSEKYHFLAYKEVFARYGHIIDEEEYYKYWTSLGHGARGEIERHKLALDPLAIRKEKLPIFSRYCEDGSIRLFDEAHELIERLASTGKILAIASGSYTDDIRAVLANAGVGNHFKAILGYEDASEIKPSPEIFNHTVAKIGLRPEECLVFEDAEKGMIAANRAGIPVIVVRTRETRGFDFVAADLVVASHQDLLQLVRSSVDMPDRH